MSNVRSLMLFGAPETFAVEAMVEPGPEYPPTVGRNVAGRVRLFMQGHPVGNFATPSVVLRSVSEHLVTLCSVSSSLWHSSLTGLAPQEQFARLDAALYAGSYESPPKAFSLCTFLTNVSEAFDPIKSFLVCPPTGNAVALVQLEPGTPVCSFEFPVREFCSAASRFASWLQSQEHALLRTGT
jgi:hypothetical protein